MGIVAVFPILAVVTIFRRTAVAEPFVKDFVPWPLNAGQGRKEHRQCLPAFDLKKILFDKYREMV
ncbi:hypothetical protein [Acutalibacter sp. 1XD8-33]|uniref:hypothetical protein n=1 Tax=Acutalibacter sp. 1XD8-33 TaxID=2320081 RepID=UPI0011C3FE97|nr:hypothetical protein [Acutalibacter sp. 1XD8-33]